MNVRTLLTRAGAAAAAGAAGALLLLLAADAAGDELRVEVEGRPVQDITVGPIVSVTVVSVVAATVAALVLARLAPRPRSWFVGLATVGLLISLVPVATAAEGAVRFWLGAMHVVVYAAVVAVLAPAIPQGRVGRHPD